MKLRLVQTANSETSELWRRNSNVLEQGFFCCYAPGEKVLTFNPILLCESFYDNNNLVIFASTVHAAI